jgi:di/tricarboxylate transporter
LPVSELPNAHAIFTLVVTVLALYLFTRDRLPLEASALTILVILIVVFALFPYEQDGTKLTATQFLEGFGNEALITISALMITSKGLETTGALQPLATSLARAWTAHPRLANLLTLFIAAIISAFVNNTPLVVMLLPMLVGVALRNKFPPSSLLMPFGFATLVGGMATTIGTSTNLLVVSIAEQLGLGEIRMFDFSLPVIIVGGVAMLYLWLIAPRLLPARKPPMSDTSPRVFNAVFHINDDSNCCDRTFSECLALTSNEMRVDRIERGEGLVVTKLPSVRIQGGDRLVVRDTPERLKEFEKRLGATLHDASGETGRSAKPEEQEHMAEIVVTRGSMLHKASLAGTRFAQRTGLLPLALHRARSNEGEEVASHIGLVTLRAGDVVLVQGTQRDLEQLKRSGTALVLDGTTNLPKTHRADTALAIFVFVVVAAALGVLPISVSSVAGVGLMLATRCMTWRDVGASLSAPVILIIVASLALGNALTATGGADYLARHFVAAVQIFPTAMILSGLMLILALLTNIVSNNAAGIIGTPIAVQIAHQLGAPAEPFVLAVIFGANMSYATPFGYQTNLLLLTSAGYKFSDFVRAGIPLTLIMWLGFSIVLPILFHL